MAVEGEELRLALVPDDEACSCVRVAGIAESFGDLESETVVNWNPRGTDGRRQICSRTAVVTMTAASVMAASHSQWAAALR